MPRRNPALWTAWLVWGMVALAGCQKGPRAIEPGAETCSYCRMGISELGFAAELVTEKGKVLPFDSIECLAASVVGGRPEEAGTPWVTDFNKPGEWIKAEDAFFIRSPKLRSPMGLNLSAYKSRAEFEKAKGDLRGAELRWQDVLLLVRSSGFAGDPHRAVPP